MAVASKISKFPAEGWRAFPMPRWSTGLGLRIGLAAVVAAAAVTAAWYGSPTRVPTPPPRPIFAAVPAKPVVAPVAKPAATPAPAPVLVALPPEPPTMSQAQETAFNGWLMGAYRQCWTAPKSMPDGEIYLPKIRVAFKTDGALSGAPRLVNPPSDPAWRPHADAALRAVKACDPLRVPDKYAAYYRQWKNRTVYFDPSAP